MFGAGKSSEKRQYSQIFKQLTTQKVSQKTFIESLREMNKEDRHDFKNYFFNCLNNEGELKDRAAMVL